MRVRTAVSILATAVWFVPAPSESQPYPPPESRKGMRKLEKLIGEAVSRVSRASVVPVLGAAESCRGYYLEGYGAFFVVSPRCLSAPAEPSMRRSLPSDAALRETINRLQSRFDEAVAEEEKARLAKSLKDLQEQLKVLQARDQTAVRERQEQEMKAFEAHVRLMQQEADRSRREAEQAMRQVADRLHMSRVAAGDGAPNPDASQTPPWHLWVDVEEPEERSPDRVIGDVKAAVVSVLKVHSGHLSFLRPEERVSVAVDFFRPTAFASCGSPQKTLLIRTQRKTLDELLSPAAGGAPLSSDAIEYVEY